MWHREGMTSDKAYSGLSLAFGDRPFEFDYFLKQVPNAYEFLELEAEKEVKIEGVIFDIDGTLVSPYADIPTEVINLLKNYQMAGKKVRRNTLPSQYSRREYSSFTARHRKCPKICESYRVSISQSLILMGSKDEEPGYCRTKFTIQGASPENTGVIEKLKKDLHICKSFFNVLLAYSLKIPFPYSPQTLQK